ncbi:MAG: DUF4249 domain-containing protein [Bacteroidota bacterium]
MGTIFIKHRVFFLIGFSLFLVMGCEKIIDIDIPDSERKIVVNGIISEDQALSVNLSKSLTVLEPDEFVYINGADVRLFSGELMIGKLTADTAGQYSLPAFKPLTGVNYRLTVDYPGLNSVEATTTVPEMVPIYSWDTLIKVSEWGYRDYVLKVVFNDPADVANYYGISVFVTYKEIDYYTMKPTGKVITRLVYIYSDSDLFLQDESHNYGGKIYFDDLLFDGQTKTTEVGLYDYAFEEADTAWVDVHLEQLDPAYFKYVVSNEAYQSTHNNPFAEPVQVYTNVSGGLGIFSSYSFASKTFTIEGSGIGKQIVPIL